MHSVLKSVFKNASRILGGNFAHAISGFMCLAMTARGLGLESFGQFVLVQTYVSVYATLISLQIWQPVIKFGHDALASDDRVTFQRILKTGWFLEIAVAIIAFLFGNGLLFWASESGAVSGEVGLAISVYMLIVIFNVSGTMGGVLRIQHRFSAIANIQILVSCFRLALVSIVWALDLGIVGFAAAWVLPESVLHLLTIRKGCLEATSLGMRSTYPSWSKFDDRLGFVKFVLTNNMDVSLRMVSRYLDLILLGIVAGKESVGIYRIAVQICSIPLRITDPIYQVLLPYFTRIYNVEGLFDLSKYVKALSVAGCLLFVCAFFGLWLIGELLIELVFGDGYTKAHDIVLIYFISAFGALAGLPFVPFFQAIGRATLCMKIQVVATLMYVVVLVPLTWWFDIVGASVAYIAYYFVWLFVCVVMFARSLKKGEGDQIPNSGV